MSKRALFAYVGYRAAFRQGLDIDRLQNSINAPDLFDLGLANEFYTTLIGPIEALIKEKHSLLIVPSGALTALPFHLLVMEKPAGESPTPAPSLRIN